MRENLRAVQHFKECEIDSISMGCNSTSQDQKYLLVFMFFSNARALFLKRLAGPPSYLEYAVGYPHCGLLSFHLCLQVTKQHVAKLIDQLTVIPSEFQTR